MATFLDISWQYSMDTLEEMDAMEGAEPEVEPKRRSLSMLSNLLDDLGLTKVSCVQ